VSQKADAMPMMERENFHPTRRKHRQSIYPNLILLSPAASYLVSLFFPHSNFKLLFFSREKIIQRQISCPMAYSDNVSLLIHEN
jgi:hypothetical protein